MDNPFPLLLELRGNLSVCQRKLELLKAGDGGWCRGRFALQGLTLKELRVTLPLLPLVFLEGAGIVALTFTGWSEEWLCVVTLVTSYTSFFETEAAWPHLAVTF